MRSACSGPCPRRGIRPDLVVGTSIGAVNGAFVAADPDGAAERLADLWQGESLRVVFSETVLGRAVRLARSGTHLHAIEPLRQAAGGQAPGRGLRGPEAPVSVRRGQHRAGDRALVHQRPGCARRHRVVRGARAAAARGDRRRPLLRWRARRFDPGWPGGRARREYRLRAAGGAYRESSPGSRPAVGSGAASRSRSRAGTGFTRRCRQLPSGVQVHVLPSGGDQASPGIAAVPLSRQKRGKWQHRTLVCGVGSLPGPAVTGGR